MALRRARERIEHKSNTEKLLTQSYCIRSSWHDCGFSLEFNKSGESGCSTRCSLTWHSGEELLTFMLSGRFLFRDVPDFEGEDMGDTDTIFRVMVVAVLLKKFGNVTLAGASVSALASASCPDLVFVRSPECFSHSRNFFRYCKRKIHETCIHV